MTLNRMQATVSNISNDPRRMSSAHPAVARASGWVQNQCFAQATLWLPLLNRNGEHRIVGTVGPAPLAILNSMLEPNCLIRAKKGQLQHLAVVAMRLNRQGAQGTMPGRYRDLQISLLSKKRGEDHKTLLSRVKSKLINVVAIRDARFSVFTI